MMVYNEKDGTIKISRASHGHHKIEIKQFLPGDFPDTAELFCDIEQLKSMHKKLGQYIAAHE